MPAEIYVVSGFLGAGKTTLIQKLLKEAFGSDRVVLIENDFGEVSVDAALLSSGGVEVKEMNSGCICCSLSGDFVKAVGEVLERFRPDKIIIEPSGVGKLSDIVKACADPRIAPVAGVKAKITVADVKRCKMYLENFGEFFEDQIKNADVVVLSRTGDYPEKVSGARAVIESLNLHAPVVWEPWDRVGADEILSSRRDRKEHEKHLEHGHDCGCRHGEHVHGEHDCCGHDHSAEDVFDTVTIRTRRIFTADDLKTRISRMERNPTGTVLRAKGIVRGVNGYVNLQYLPGDLKIADCKTTGDMLCVIGRNLDERELKRLFGGE